MPKSTTSTTRPFPTDLFDPNALRHALSMAGTGYYLSHRPIVSHQVITKLKNSFAIIPPAKMHVLFNDREVTDVLSKINSDGKISIGSSSNSSAIYGRQYLPLKDVERLIRSSPDKDGLEELRTNVKKIMNSLSECLDTPFVFGEQSLLRSVNICPLQKVHCDNSPFDVDETKPDLSLIVFLDEPSKLEVFRRGHVNIREDVQFADAYGRMQKTVKVSKGHCIIFRHDLPHCGSATMRDNERVFFSFCRPTGQARKAKEVKTFLVQLTEGSSPDLRELSRNQEREYIFRQLVDPSLLAKTIGTFVEELVSPKTCSRYLHFIVCISSPLQLDFTFLTTSSCTCFISHSNIWLQTNDPAFIDNLLLRKCSYDLPTTCKLQTTINLVISDNLDTFKVEKVEPWCLLRENEVKNL